jgi:hypothetical protein
MKKRSVWKKSKSGEAREDTDLRKRIRIDKPTMRVNYDFNVDLLPQIDRFLEELKTPRLEKRRTGRR